MEEEEEEEEDGRMEEGQKGLELGDNVTKAEGGIE